MDTQDLQCEIRALHVTEENLRAENEAHARRNTVLEECLKEVGRFLHHCWCDVQMNEYSYARLTQMMELVDAAKEEINE